MTRLRWSRRMAAGVLLCAGVGFTPAAGLADVIDDTTADGGYVGVITLPGSEPTDGEPRVNPGCTVVVEQGEPKYDPRDRSIYGRVVAFCDTAIPQIWTRGFLDQQVASASECLGEHCTVVQKAADAGHGTQSATAVPRFGCDDTDPPDPERCRGLWRTRGFVEFTFEHPVSDGQLGQFGGPSAWQSCFRGDVYTIKCHAKTPRTTPAEPPYPGNCSGPGCITVPDENDPVDIRWYEYPW